jgi:glycosyltransferase involved in cell wall biosynthesis
MKIAVCASTVPFMPGGASNMVDWLTDTLREYGHQVEVVALPMVDRPETLYQQMEAYRWVDLSAADRIICLRPPALMIPHACKIIWFIHHIRVFYDLWDSPFRTFPDDAKHRSIRAALVQADTAALREARAVFTNSRTMSDRLSRYNGVASEVLYPPLFRSERFRAGPMSDEIVCVSRLVPAKRQHLLIEALSYTRTGVKLRLCGAGASPEYPTMLRAMIAKAGLEDRVTLENEWISEERKVEVLSNCLAAAYIPLNEDSYGYAGLEASHSSKALLTTSDAGGVLELIGDGINGLVVEADPWALGDAMDRLFLDREAARRMGERALARLTELHISWPHVIGRLLA